MKRGEWGFTSMLAKLLFLATHEPRPEYDFLLERGWTPFGKKWKPGIEKPVDQWGKLIDGKPTLFDEAEALAMEGWTGKGEERSG